MQFLCTFVVWITVQTISATNTPIIIITPMEKNGEWYTTQAKCSYNLDQTYNQLQIKVAIVTNCQVLQCSLNAQNMQTSSVGGYTHTMRNSNVQNAGDFSVIFEMQSLTAINISGHCDFTIPQQGGMLLSSACMCPCGEIGRDANRNYTEEEIAHKIEEIVKELTIDKKKTSAAKNRRISAADDRPSAKAVGTVGIVMLSVTLGILILFDVDNFIRFIIELKKK